MVLALFYKKLYIQILIIFILYIILKKREPLNINNKINNKCEREHIYGKLNTSIQIDTYHYPAKKLLFFINHSINSNLRRIYLLRV